MNESFRVTALKHHRSGRTWKDPHRGNQTITGIHQVQFLELNQCPRNEAFTQPLC